MHKENNNQRIFDNHGNITQSGDIVNIHDSKIKFFNSNGKFIVKLIYGKDTLINEKEILSNLLSLSNNNFDFKIEGLDNVFLQKELNYLTTELKIKYFNKLKLRKNIFEKTINDFISEIYKVTSLFYIIVDDSNQDEARQLLSNFILKEKVKLNQMPDLKDRRLALRFYEENIDFDFIKLYGYDFNKLLTIYDLINIHKKFNNYDILQHDLYNISNHNHSVLEFFLSPYHIEKWTFKYLEQFIEELNIKSNLLDTNAKTIDELFDFAIHEYFKDEDIKEWEKLQKFYIKTLKNPNASTLELFFQDNKSQDWNLNNLLDWIEKQEIKTELSSISANSIDDIFNLVVGNGYFINEDIVFWNNLQKHYIFTIYEI